MKIYFLGKGQVNERTPIRDNKTGWCYIELKCQPLSIIALTIIEFFCTTVFQR